MNQVGYNPAEVHPSHMATTHAHPPTTQAMGSHYAPYPNSVVQTHGYPPYTPNYTYSSYAPPPVTSSMPNIPVVSQVHPPPQLNTMQQPQGNIHAAMDTTGQVAPPGVKPRVTATLWEDEGSLCFQVEAKGICVARREDNHMINGTKLLNVAGMTRGRRDGILKSEKTRHVVKIGPMHLKGVWIPFDRALEFANKEKITELLYPLFVHDIGALLYHPQNPNQHRASVSNANTMAALDRTRDRRALNQPQHPIAQHSQMVSPSQSRPGIDRAHTFPTPPASASSVVNMSQNATYDYTMNAQPLSIDTGISQQHQRSVPNTPASTPPGKTSQGAAHYPTPQSYEASRSVYSNSATQPQYPSQVRFGGPLPSAPYQKKDSEHDHESDYHASQPSYNGSYSSASYSSTAPTSNGTDLSRSLPESPSQIHHSAPRSAVQPRVPPTQSWNTSYPPPHRSNTAPSYVPPPAQEHTNGYYHGMKRGRDDDDDEIDEVKRTKTDHEEGGPVGSYRVPVGVPVKR